MLKESYLDAKIDNAAGHLIEFKGGFVSANTKIVKLLQQDHVRDFRTGKSIQFEQSSYINQRAGKACFRQ